MATLDPSHRPRRREAARRATRRRRRLVGGAVALVLVAAVAGVLLLRSGGPHTAAPPSHTAQLRPGSAAGDGIDPLRYTPARRAEFERRAADGAAHVLYARSIGGATTTAERVAALRPQIEAATRGTDVDPDVLEAIVFLESGGRPDALASNDLNGAVGLTQILAQTGRDLLGMRIDVAQSTALTKRIAKGGRKQAARKALRARVDERFDVEKSLAATVRYLQIAKEKLGSEERAIVSYHMGIGNLQKALSLYGAGADIPYAELSFGASPLHQPAAYAFLSGLGDDSSTYLWRVRAAEEIMRLYRQDPAKLQAQATLQLHKNSAEEVLRPQATTPQFRTADDIRAALASRRLVPLSAPTLARYGVRIDPGMGSLAPTLGERTSTYRALTPEALAVLEYIGAGVRAISAVQPLLVTSTVRDAAYQRALTRMNIEATHAFSLHTTGNAFDLSRSYKTPAQGQALQFLLDRLTSLNVIAWVREPAAIHVTAGPLAKELLSPQVR